MKKCVTFLLILFVFIPCMALYAKDFGVLLDQTAEAGGYGSDWGFDYSGTVTPWFSSPIGENGDIYVSAGFTVKNDSPYFVPELLRTEFFWLFDWGDLKAGRMYYSEPLGFIANGLFDGARASLDMDFGILSAGVWYTGLLYKDTAKITMTAKEREASSVALDYGNFVNTYFAPSRFVTAVGWEHPSLLELFGARLTALGQFDMSGVENLLHSQYFIAGAVIPLQVFVFELGGALELMQNAGKTGVALAGELGVSWIPPISLESQLSLMGRFTSGGSDGTMSAFVPLTTVEQGDVLQANISGLSIISLGYTARIRPDFSASLSSSLFVRSDKGTYTAYPVSSGEDGYFLGTEFFARAFWSPASDVMLNCGGGAFVPALNADTQWRFELNIVLSLY